MPTSFVLLFPGLPGGPELIVVLLIVVLLFGANKLPKLARSSGQAMGEFKKGREEIEEELQDMRDGAVGEMDDSRGDQAPQGNRSQADQYQQDDQPQENQRQGGQQQGNQPQGNQRQSGQRQGNQRQGNQRQGGQRQGNQRQGGQSSSDTSADEWGSAATNRDRDRETNRR
jgi:sec-independent protein translocase protein TatA